MGPFIFIEQEKASHRWSELGFTYLHAVDVRTGDISSVEAGSFSAVKAIF